MKISISKSKWLEPNVTVHLMKLTEVPELFSRWKHELHQKTQACGESLWKHQGMWESLVLVSVGAINSITTQNTDDCWTSVLLGDSINGVLKESGNTPINWLMSHLKLFISDFYSDHVMTPRYFSFVWIT